MWTKQRLLQAMADRARLCVLLLSQDTDGAYIVQTLSENGSTVPCRKASDKKSAVRRMAELYRKTADADRRVTIAQTDAYTAALLAGELRKDTSFEPLEPTLGQLGLLYSGSLRSSPLV